MAFRKKLDTASYNIEYFSIGKFWVSGISVSFRIFISSSVVTSFMEAWKIYQYGPDHPLSKKILKHKIRDSSLKKLKKKEQEKMMKKLFLEGYSKNAIAEAFECLPETVTARIKRAEEDTNGT